MTDGPIETPQEEVVPEVSGPPVVDAPEVSAGNPAWAPILEVLPASLHGLVRPKLEEWDKGVETRFETLNKKWDPYKEFIESQPDPVQLRQGLQLARNLGQDPVAFYNHMGERLRAAGLLEEIKQQQQQQAPDPLEEEAEQDFRDPRLDGLMQQIQEAQQRQEQEAQIAAADQQIASEFAALEQRLGRVLPDEIKARVVQQAQIDLDAAIRTGRPAPTIGEAYDSLMAFATRVTKPVPAPTVLPPSGGGGSLPAKTSYADFANDGNARRAAAVALMQTIHGQQ